ncbi:MULTISPECIES: hypothetical protein [Methylotenera]|uniref:hypothetical protein n=1 Tax=Methylotenera TaxID=359407 RepID=UPI00037DC5B9|nr:MULTISPECIES: hypothetical protein [Methylotenera]
MPYSHESISEYIDKLSLHKRNITTEANEAWGRCNFSLSEPEIIEDFVKTSGMGISHLNSTIAATFNASQKRFSLKFGGIFAHQRPYVQRLKPYTSDRKGTNPTEKCELADLALINIFLDKNRNVIYSSASLFQAKKDETVVKNLTQAFLYDYDEKFEYDSSAFASKTPCAHGQRELPRWDKNRSSALQYLLLSSSNPLATKVRQSPWVIDHKHDFGFFLYRMLTFSAGKSFKYNLRKIGKWSSIVYDLLTMAAGGMRGKARGSGDLDIVIERIMESNESSLNFQVNDQLGVSLLLAITQDTEIALDTIDS